MSKKEKIVVQGTEITLFIKPDGKDYISLTDIAKYRNSIEPFSVINNWIRSRSAIEFIGLWEQLNNPDFKPIEFERFRMEAGSNYFVLSPQRWVEATNAVGIKHQRVAHSSGIAAGRATYTIEPCRNYPTAILVRKSICSKT